MTSPSTPSPDTRQRILDAARDLFWRQGYSATGIAQILKAADANSGSLYYFFPTKEDLLLAVLEWYKANLWPEVIQPVFDRVTDPIERPFCHHRKTSHADWPGSGFASRSAISPLRSRSIALPERL